MGICKVNVGSDFRLNARNRIKDNLDNIYQLDYWRILDEGYKERMQEKMETFGSAGKAWTR